jgi:hypothetical protein
VQRLPLIAQVHEFGQGDMKGLGQEIRTYASWIVEVFSYSEALVRELTGSLASPALISPINPRFIRQTVGTFQPGCGTANGRFTIEQRNNVDKTSLS